MKGTELFGSTDKSNNFHNNDGEPEHTVLGNKLEPSGLPVGMGDSMPIKPGAPGEAFRPTTPESTPDPKPDEGLSADAVPDGVPAVLAEGASGKF